MEAEKATLCGLNKGCGSKFDKRLKKARGHISQNQVNITIKMKSKFKKPE